MSIFDDPEMQALLESFREKGMPGMKDSAFCLAVMNADPDPKLCLEIGAAVLLDKPIILAVKRGTDLPANVRRVAASIIEMDDFSDSAAQTKLVHAIKSLMSNDERVRKFKARKQ